jgi:hypothetical protein
MAWHGRQWRKPEATAAGDFQPCFGGHAMIAISEKRVFGRLKRRLQRKEGLTLHRYKGGKWFSDLGRFYTTDDRNFTFHTHIDLEYFAREYGVLKPTEQMAD